MTADGRLLAALRDATESIGRVIEVAKADGREAPPWLVRTRDQLGVEYEVLSARGSGRDPLLLPGERGTL